VLAVLALLLVLILSIASVLNVETRASATGKDLLLARQNALLGLDTAISQLQQYAGKDQAVTFPATTFFPTKDVTNGSGDLFDSPRFGYRQQARTARRGTYLTPAERSGWDTALKDWWNNNNQPRNPRWVGIMDASLRVDRASNPITAPAALAAQVYETNPATKFGEPKRDQLPVWLVSGNERFHIDQDTGWVTDSSGTRVGEGQYPADYQTPDQPLSDPSADESVLWLVGSGSATPPQGAADGMEGRVKVRKQRLEVSKNPGAAPVLSGHYAYWVGDESTKANFAVRDPYFQAEPGSLDYRNRLQVPQRIAWENLNGFQTATFDINDAKLQNISTSREIGLMERTNTAEIKEAARANFHALTAFSKSLQTDTALGGLKKDLTVFFEGNGGPAATTPVLDASRYLPRDPRLGAVNNGFPASTQNLPLWGDLKSWHDALANGGGSAQPRPGMAPVFANYQLFFAVTHQGGLLQFHVIPMIALWNPFDAPLASTTYTLRWRHNWAFTDWAVGTRNPAYTDPTPAENAAGYADGKKLGDYFLSPQTPMGWYAPGQKNFGTSFAALWRNTRPWYWFSPFDTARDGGLTEVPNPDSPNATWVPYRFTTGFDPGEVKVFTVDGMQQVDPKRLHDGTTFVQMSNRFDPQFPDSYYFNLAQNIGRGPFNQAPLATDEVRWHGVLPYGSIPKLNSLELRAEGQVLWRNYFTGGLGEWYKAINGSFDPANPLGEGQGAPSKPANWKRVYELSQWRGIPKGARDTVAEKDSPIVGLYRAQIAPFLVPPDAARSDGDYMKDGLALFYRGFATFNLFAKSTDPIRDLDLARSGKWGGENADGFRTLQSIRAENNSAQQTEPMRWDDGHVLSGAGSARGFALLGRRQTDAFDNTSISVLPARHVRRPQSHLLSLGQLQQANLSPSFWQPSFPIANSEASPYVDRAAAAGLQSYTIRNVAAAVGMDKMLWPNAALFDKAQTFPNNPANEFVDLSYLLNENLWDSYFLSSVPQSSPVATDNTVPLRNGRHRFRADARPTPAEARDPATCAAYLENLGALNVNSTSEEAWKALLTAFRGLAISGGGNSNPPSTVPVSRTLEPAGGPIQFGPSGATPADFGANSTGARNYEKLFLGFRALSDAQIQTLAERIVDEIRLRGPFLSLADFVNRRLTRPDNTNGTWTSARTMNSLGHGGIAIPPIGAAYRPLAGMSGINGALQRALNLSGINGGMNYPGNANDAVAVSDRVFRVDTTVGRSVSGRPMQISSDPATYLDTEHLAGVPAGEVGQLLSHSPGFVTQGDLLAMLGPALTPRGDTFLVRTYGDTVDSKGNILARAYLEAVVQRIPEPVTPAGESGEDRWRPTDRFGRKFKTVHFRWLRPEEV
jgi:hypothetical protein